MRRVGAASFLGSTPLDVPGKTRIDMPAATIAFDADRSPHQVGVLHGFVGEIRLSLTVVNTYVNGARVMVRDTYTMTDGNDRSMRYAEAVAGPAGLLFLPLHAAARTRYLLELLRSGATVGFGTLALSPQGVHEHVTDHNMAALTPWDRFTITLTGPDIHLHTPARTRQIHGAQEPAILNWIVQAVQADPSLLVPTEGTS